MRAKRSVRPKRPKSFRHRRNAAFLGWAILFCGAILMLMPDINKVGNDLKVKAEVETAYRAVSLASGVTIVDDDVQTEDDLTAASSENTASVDDALIVANKADSSRPWLEEYNERVRSGTGPGINDPFTFAPDDQSFAETGLADLPIGVLTVRSMDVEVPVYLGSTDENMRRGATVVAGTSAPLGETSSNCVIAAHRSTFFREMENVKAGDRVELRTIWGSYVYEVSETKLIYPSEVSAVSVQSGRDLLTISTCHPYGETTQRILAICERVSGAQVESVSASVGNGSFENGLDEARESAGDAVQAIVGVEPVVSIVRTVTSGEAPGELLIEDCGRVFGRLILAVIAVRLVVWLASCSNNSRKRRGKRFAPRRRRP